MNTQAPCRALGRKIPACLRPSAIAPTLLHPPAGCQLETKSQTQYKPWNSIRGPNEKKKINQNKKLESELKAKTKMKALQAMRRQCASAGAPERRVRAATTAHVIATALMPQDASPASIHERAPFLQV